MALPLVGGAAALLAKLGGGAAARAAAGTAAKKLILPTAAKAVGKKGIGRMAGDAVKRYMGGDINFQNVAMNFGPDAFFGAMQGAATPGDLGDKIIAGVSTGVGGALGGVGAVSLLPGATTNNAMRMLGEFGGGYGGDMVGQMVGDTVLRAKGGGTTPWEKVQMDQDQQYRAQLEREMLAKLGLGGYNQTDLFMKENGLA